MKILSLLLLWPVVVHSQLSLSSVAPDYSTQTLKLAEGFHYEIIFAEGDSILSPKFGYQPARGSHDFNAFITRDSSTAWLYTSHETHLPNKVFGDGGGGTITSLIRENGKWKKSGIPVSINFDRVYGTIRNCGGSVTPNGTILTAEEASPSSNTDLVLNEGITDTGKVNNRDRYLQYGWMVEVDPTLATAVRKCWKMGRYAHEDIHIMPDNQTIYLTADETPAVLFKYVGKVPGDYENGDLYAYQQSEDGLSGNWLSMPGDFESLSHAIPTACRLGATLFVRHEWIDGKDDKLYITETGSDQFSLEAAVALGGKPAKHLMRNGIHLGKFNFQDPYGRVLVLDLKSGKLESFIEGGLFGKDSAEVFSNPDALCIAKIKNKNVLVISEDNNGINYGKVSREAYQRKEQYNELYMLDLSIPKPELKDLIRFAVGPRGCETTGSAFSPDFKTMFLSVQSPSKDNRPPFNRSCVVMINGL